MKILILAIFLSAMLALTCGGTAHEVNERAAQSGGDRRGQHGGYGGGSRGQSGHGGYGSGSGGHRGGQQSGHGGYGSEHG
ncbi:hypothetical protein X975_23466, partial [Stegodyphus mimosarum]